MISPALVNFYEIGDPTNQTNARMDCGIVWGDYDVYNETPRGNWPAGVPPSSAPVQHHHQLPHRVRQWPTRPPNAPHVPRRVHEVGRDTGLVRADFNSRKLPNLSAQDEFGLTDERRRAGPASMGVQASMEEYECEHAHEHGNPNPPPPRQRSKAFGHAVAPPPPLPPSPPPLKVSNPLLLPKNRAPSSTITAPSRVSHRPAISRLASLFRREGLVRHACGPVDVFVSEGGPGQTDQTHSAAVAAAHGVTAEPETAHISPPPPLQVPRARAAGEADERAIAGPTSTTGATGTTELFSDDEDDSSSTVGSAPQSGGATSSSFTSCSSAAPTHIADEALGAESSEEGMSPFCTPTSQQPTRDLVAISAEVSAICDDDVVVVLADVPEDATCVKEDQCDTDGVLVQRMSPLGVVQTPAVVSTAFFEVPNPAAARLPVAEPTQPSPTAEAKTWLQWFLGQ